MGEVLWTRFSRLSLVESHALVQPQRLGDALIAAVARLHGAEAVMVTEPNYSTCPAADQHRIYYLLDQTPDKVLHGGEIAESGRIVTLAFDDGDAQRWRRAFLTATPEVGDDLRRQSLADHLQRATVLRMTVAERLVLPYPVGMVETTRWAHQYGALLLWWRSRLRQGYTTEVATTMLSLTCDPSVLAHLTFATPAHGTLTPELAPPSG